jgi:hypothetical protein
MEYIIDRVMCYWPGTYYATQDVYRAAAYLVYVWVWHLWAILAGILATIIAIVVGKCTKEWRYAIVLGVCGWMPTLLLGTILFRALITMAQGYHEASRLLRAERERRHARRRQERRREEELMIAFNASISTLGEPSWSRNVPLVYSESEYVRGLELAGTNGVSI